MDVDTIRTVYFWVAFDSKTKECLASGQFFNGYDSDRVETERKRWMNKPNRTFICNRIDENGSDEVMYDTNWFG